MFREAQEAKLLLEFPRGREKDSGAYVSVVFYRLCRMVVANLLAECLEGSQNSGV